MEVVTDTGKNCLECDLKYFLTLTRNFQIYFVSTVPQSFFSHHSNFIKTGFA